MSCLLVCSLVRELHIGLLKKQIIIKFDVIFCTMYSPRRLDIIISIVKAQMHDLPFSTI